MESQSPPPAPACKQSGDITEACPSCGIFPDDLSFCLWLNHSKIHQALALPGAPCAQGATEQESAFLFSEATWKIACGAISPAVTYRDHVPSYMYMCEGKWRDHPSVLHRLKVVRKPRGRLRRLLGANSALSGKLSRLSSNQDHLVFLTNLLISAVRLGMSIMRYYYASTAVSL